MQENMQQGLIFLTIMVVAVAAFSGFTIHRLYKRNTAALEMYKDAVQIHPQKSSFIISWFVFFVGVSIPQLMVIWFLPFVDRGLFTFMGFYLPIGALLLYFPTYPYYTVILREDKIIGATLWGWGWKRAEINVNEFASSDVLKQSPGRSLKITVLKSTGGIKILTLGLSDLQIKQILECTRKK